MERPGPPPRYAPAQPLPARPYRLRRGWPRPRATAPGPLAAGPSGAPAGAPLRLPADLTAPAVEALRHGVDLFNAACWWEAHEVWEALWATAERGAPLHALLQGLILLAAAHLQHECGRRRGAARLAGRARACLLRGGEQLPDPAPLGLPLAALLLDLERWPASTAGSPATTGPIADPAAGAPAPATIRLELPAQGAAPGL